MVTVCRESVQIMAKFKFSDLTSYLHGDIMKYMDIQDQIEHQRMNKTWRDWSRSVIRQCRTLVLGYGQPPEFSYTDQLMYREPILYVKSYRPIKKFLESVKSTNLSELKTIVVTDEQFDDDAIQADTDLSNLPSTIYHLYIYVGHLKDSFVTKIVESANFTSLKRLTVCDTSQEVIKLIKLNEASIEQLYLGRTHAIDLETIMMSSLKSLKRLQVSLIDEEDELLEERIIEFIKKLPNLTQLKVGRHIRH